MRSNSSNPYYTPMVNNNINNSITNNTICPGITNNNCWNIALQGYIERTVNTIGIYKC